MFERIQELSPDEVNRLKSLGETALASISPPIAQMIYGDSPDQIAAINNLGPDALGALSPQLADFLYGPDASNVDSELGDVAGDFEKGLGQYPQLPPPPPFTPDPGEMVAWWSFADACEVCIDNAAAEPRPYGEPFPSGDVEPPMHDHCRCELVSTMRSACPIRGYSRYDNRIFELSSRY